MHSQNAAMMKSQKNWLEENIEKTLDFPNDSYYNPPVPAGMMELVDVADSKSAASDGVPVRLRLPAPRRRTLRTAQKNQSLAAAGFSSAVLRGASFSPRDPLCWARVGSLFIRGLAVFLWKSEAISVASPSASLTSGTSNIPQPTAKVYPQSVRFCGKYRCFILMFVIPYVCFLLFFFYQKLIYNRKHLQQILSPSRS